MLKKISPKAISNMSLQYTGAYDTSQENICIEVAPSLPFTYTGAIQGLVTMTE